MLMGLIVGECDTLALEEFIAKLDVWLRFLNACATKFVNDLFQM